MSWAVEGNDFEAARRGLMAVDPIDVLGDVVV